MLKRARSTASYQDVRHLLKLWLYSRKMIKLLEKQNQRLYQAAKERDKLISHSNVLTTHRDKLIEENKYIKHFVKP